MVPKTPHMGTHHAMNHAYLCTVSYISLYHILVNTFHTYIIILLYGNRTQRDELKSETLNNIFGCT